MTLRLVVDTAVSACASAQTVDAHAAFPVPHFQFKCSLGRRFAGVHVTGRTGPIFRQEPVVLIHVVYVILVYFAVEMAGVSYPTVCPGHTMGIFELNYQSTAGKLAYTPACCVNAWL